MPGLQFIFFFFGTFLHEAAHYFSALVLGTAEGFSLLPRMEGGRFVFGSVRYRTRYKVLSSFVASAPLLWWALLLLFMMHSRLLSVSSGMPKVDFSQVFQRVHNFSGRDLLFIWLSLQMLWAGRLSVPDIKNILMGFFSVSGFLFMAGAGAAIYLSAKFL